LTIFKVFITSAICCSLYFGGMIAKYGASFLEENEIFIPTEDDDDD
uniref:Essential MCU regulator, mitochondrial n=1 Tax=Rhabditophanes sp. KR3021 TaxID=114890 RepID=A0AC35U5Y3_9BILA